MAKPIEDILRIPEVISLLARNISRKDNDENDIGGIGENWTVLTSIATLLVLTLCSYPITTVALLLSLNIVNVGDCDASADVALMKVVKNCWSKLITISLIE